MDIDIQKRVDEALERVKKIAPEEIESVTMDPVARMMMVAMEGETQLVMDEIRKMEQRIADRFCTHFIPYQQIGATPAITILALQTKHKEDKAPVKVIPGAVFSLKSKNIKTPLNYTPLFATNVMPYVRTYVVTHRVIKYDNKQTPVNMNMPNRMFIGINTLAEADSLQGMSIMFKGTHGIAPSHISVGTEHKELNFTTMQKMEDIEMLEPFDAQQSSDMTFAFYQEWKSSILRLNDLSMVFLTDDDNDRDAFKHRPYPRAFQQWMEDDTLDSFDPETIWLQVDFPEGFVVPDPIEVTLNVQPVVNVDVCSANLTQATPVVKLQKQDNSFFLGVLETTAVGQKQGYEKRENEVIVRDFDAACYHDGDLYRDVRQLYHHFVDDYYAFVEYHKIKDGELLKRLRQTVNELGKSVLDEKTGEPLSAKFKYDSGTYAMKSLHALNSTAKITYITTQGAIGNSPLVGDTMENKKMPAIAREVKVLVNAMCGTDKVSADSRYELLRYYSLTNDRLYTKMDIDAFLRKEIMVAFGKKEFQRIFIKMNVEGTGSETGLKRGLYIDIEFKDKKNFERAQAIAFDTQMKQKIDQKACLSIPVIVNLVNLDN